MICQNTWLFIPHCSLDTSINQTLSTLGYYWEDRAVASPNMFIHTYKAKALVSSIAFCDVWNKLPLGALPEQNMCKYHHPSLQEQKDQDFLGKVK